MATKIPAQLRLLVPADAGLYREVRLEGLRNSPDAFGSTFAQTSARPLQWFADRLAQSSVFGAFLGDELSGIAGYQIEDGPKDGHKALLWGMYVRPSAQNRGIGKQLVGAILHHAAGRVEQINLTVVTENAIALRLYRSLGFVEYGLEKRAHRLDGRYHDEVLMVRFLATP